MGTSPVHRPDAAPVTVRDAAYRLLERHGLTTVFGNPGSNELPFLAGLPDTFRYVLGLHEGVVVGMADGFAQARRGAAFVNLHAASGTGNAMGALTNAAASRTPLLLTAGQQVRSAIGPESMLANVDATTLTRPLTGHAAEPACAADVPRSLAQALAEATNGGGPSYVSVPYDDWDAPAPPDVTLATDRVVRRGGGLSAAVEDDLVSRLRSARSPALVVGGDLDGAVPPGRLVALAETLGATVWAAPSLFRLPFPNRHRLFAGVLPAGIASVADRLDGHDLVLVLGAPVFRYHQHEPGRLLTGGTAVVQVTDDLSAAARAPLGDAVLADPAAVVDRLVARLDVPPDVDLWEDGPGRFRACDPVPEVAAGEPLPPALVFATLREALPRDAAYVVESTSTNADFWAQSDLREAGSYYFPAAGGLGFGMPAAVGVAMADPERTVVGVIGDGSANYGLPALWSAARYDVRVTFVILRNGGYGALEWFGELLGVPDAPGTRLGGIDFVSLAEGYGVPAVHVDSAAHLAKVLHEPYDGPRLVEVDTTPSRPV